jgi:hypothetical protein
MGRVGQPKNSKANVPAMRRRLMSTFGREVDIALPFAVTPAFHKRCNTIETNTTTIIAKIIICAVALSKNPGRPF